MQTNFNEIIPFFESAVQALGTKVNEIKRMDQDVFCRCPVCGDSKRGNKKRLHLYQKGDVINVNCFNGDCQVKNYTPYRFFKEFHQRTFNEFQNFYRKRYLLEIQGSAKKGLESWESNEQDLFEVNYNKTFKSEIVTLVKDFEFSGDDDKDFIRVKDLVTKIKDLGDEAYQEFKRMLK